MLNTIIINNEATTRGGDIDLSNCLAYAYYSWYNDVSGYIHTYSSSPCITEEYTEGDLGTLQDNGGSTNTMALSSGSPATESGTYAYYNSDKGYYYFVNTYGNAVCITGSSTVVTVVESDKIVEDQRGSIIYNLPSIGAYYKLIPYYKTVSDGDWNDVSIWEISVDGTTWEASTETPNASNSCGISIENDVAITENIEIDQTTVTITGSLTVGSGVMLTVADGKETDLTITGELNESGTGELVLNSDTTVLYNGGNQTIVAAGYSELQLANNTTGVSTTKTFSDNTTSIAKEISITDSITLTGSSADNVTVQVTKPGEGGTASRVFNIDAEEETVTISNMTIKGGDVSSLMSTRVGGSVYIEAGVVNLNSVIVTGSYAEYGGGIYNGGTITITDSTISSNSAERGGGGIDNGGTITITDSTISSNSAGEGGGIYNGEIITITDSTISSNSAERGGGIFNFVGRITITDSTISSNICSSNEYPTFGGGIYNYVGSFTMLSSTISENRATYGAGIYSKGAEYRDAIVCIVSSTISNNKTLFNEQGTYGGGILTIVGQLYVINSTISGNSADTGGGGIYNHDSTSYLLNSIIINNQAETGGDIYIIGDNSMMYAYYSWYYDHVGYIEYDSSAPNVIEEYTDGDLGELSDNGGSTYTMAMSVDAPAVGTGTYAYVYYNNLDSYYFVDSTGISHLLDFFDTHPIINDSDKVTTDQRGYILDASNVSIGAYGCNATPPVLTSFKFAEISDQTLDENFSITITAYDQGGNIYELNEASSVILYKSGENAGEYGVTFVEGVGVGNITIEANGDYYFGITYKEITGQSNSFTVSGLHEFKFDTIEAQTVNAGFEITVTALTEEGEVYENLTYCIINTTLYNSGVNAGEYEVVFIDGVGRAYVGVEAEGNYYFEIAYEGIIGKSNSFNVVGESKLYEFDFDTISNKKVDEIFNITVTCYDQHGSVYKGNGTLDATLYKSGENAGEYEVVFIDGVGTADITIEADGKYYFEIVYGGITGKSNIFNITGAVPGPSELYEFDFDEISTQNTYIPFNITVTAYADDGSVYENLDETVDLTLYKSGEEAGEYEVTFEDGVGIGNITIDAAGDYYFKISYEGVIDQSNSFIVESQGSVYEYQTVLDGEWDDLSVWVRRVEGSEGEWEALTSTDELPDYTDGSIVVNNTIEITENITIDQTTISSSGSLFVVTGATLTVNDGDGDDLTANGSISAEEGSCLLINSSAVLDSNAAFTIDGELSFDDGSEECNGILELSSDDITIENVEIGCSTITYDSDSVNQTVLDIDYYNLSLYGSGKITLAGTVNGTFDIGSPDTGENALIFSSESTIEYGPSAILKYSASRTATSLEMSGVNNLSLREGADVTFSCPIEITGAFENTGIITIATGEDFSITAATIVSGNIENTIEGCGITLNASDGIVSLNGNIITNGGDIEINDDISLIDNSVINANGGDVSVNAIIGSEYDLVLENSDSGITTVNGVIEVNNLDLSGNGIFNLDQASSTVSGDITIGSSSILNLGMQTLQLAGDFVNSGIFSSSGEILLNGTTLQEITSRGCSFAGLSLKNSAGALLNDDVTVSDSLILDSGLLILNSNDLTLGADADLTGNFSESAMIVTSEGGNLIRGIQSVGTYIMPIGTYSDSDAEYSPVTVTYNQGDFSDASCLIVSAAAEKESHNTDTTNYLNRYWYVESEGISNFKVDLTFKYAASDIVGEESAIYLGEYDNGTWTRYNAADVETRTLSGNSLSKFCDFTGISSGITPTPTPDPYKPSVDNGMMINDSTQIETHTSWRTSIDNGAQNDIDSDEGFDPNEVEGVGLTMGSMISFDLSVAGASNGEYSVGTGSASAFMMDGEYGLSGSSIAGMGDGEYGAGSENEELEMASDEDEFGAVDLTFNFDGSDELINFEGMAVLAQKHPTFKTELDLLLEKI